jgi:hypothetical protein
MFKIKPQITGSMLIVNEISLILLPNIGKVCGEAFYLEQKSNDLRHNLTE